MTIYKYRAKKGVDEVVEGRLEARSEKEALEKINQLGILPIRIEEESGIPAVKTQVVAKTVGRIGSREITIFNRQLASLLKSGVPILSAINIIFEQSENPHLRVILKNMHDSLKDGATFSSVLMQYPRIFSPLYVAMIRTGEDSGALPEVLIRIADYRTKQDEMFSRFRMAMAYPILMAVVGLGTITFMLTFVIPRLMGIFTNLGQQLPLPTQILISISHALLQWWYWILLILFVVIFMVRQEMKTKQGKMFSSMLTLRLPLIKDFILKAELARFNRTLELLLRNGISILKAIELAIPVLDNEVIKNQLGESYKELEQGGSLGKSLRSSKIFPMFMVNLISVGEESGRLEESLAEVANTYEFDTDESMKIMSSLLEPLTILGMGLLVGFMVIAMLLPLFEINMMVK